MRHPFCRAAESSPRTPHAPTAAVRLVQPEHRLLFTSSALNGRPPSGIWIVTAVAEADPWQQKVVKLARVKSRLRAPQLHNCGTNEKL